MVGSLSDRTAELVFGVGRWMNPLYRAGRRLVSTTAFLKKTNMAWPSRRMLIPIRQRPNSETEAWWLSSKRRRRLHQGGWMAAAAAVGFQTMYLHF